MSASTPPIDTPAPAPAAVTSTPNSIKGLAPLKQLSSIPKSSPSAPPAAAPTTTSDSSDQFTNSSSNAPPTLSLTTDTDSSSNATDSPSPAHALSSHPLQRTWTFHYSLPTDKNKGWNESAIMPICSVSTVEQFWGVYNSLTLPARLPLRADLHFFVQGVQPTWEEPMNVHGGRWLIEYKSDEQQLNDGWQATLLGLLGEMFSDGEEIMGAVMNNRGKKNRIQIWTKSASNRAAMERIGSEWKQIVQHRGRIGFLSHEDCKVADAKPKIAYEV